MDLRQLAPHVWQLPFPVGHVHLVALSDDAYAAVDTGLPGSAPAILDAITRLGGRPGALRQIVLTHCHVDHMGSAADLVAATGPGSWPARRRSRTSRAPGPSRRRTSPRRTGPARAGAGRHRRRRGPAAAPHPGRRRAPRRRRPRRLAGARPGAARSRPHPGSIALHLPESRVLFPGDAVATDPDGTRVLLGPLNVDRARAIASFRRLAALDEVDTVCVPHGVPVRSDGHAALAAATPEADWR
ncbi:MBL fold metallo-hydrolase [Streptomyces albulus]|nr:MBL fold metallo-hydrolase [Streptomyces noursei]